MVAVGLRKATVYKNEKIIYVHNCDPIAMTVAWIVYVLPDYTIVNDYI